MGFTMCEYTFMTMSVIALILATTVIGLYSQAMLRERKVRQLQKELATIGVAPTPPTVVPTD